MKSVLLINEDARLQEAVLRALRIDGYGVWWAPNATVAEELLADLPLDLLIVEYTPPATDERNVIADLRRNHPRAPIVLTIEHVTSDAVLEALRLHICDFLAGPFTPEELRETVNAAISRCPAHDFEVISAQPEWIELLVPCDRATFSPLLKLLAAVEADIPAGVSEAINYAFSEMLSNVIEHGCKLDQTKRVVVSILRLKRAVICRIKDPGEGFDPDVLECAAINNPIDDPIHHLTVRENKRRRAGGFGILMTRNLVDDLVYNERHNELMFVKFLP